MITIFENTGSFNICLERKLDSVEGIQKIMLQVEGNKVSNIYASINICHVTEAVDMACTKYYSEYYT